jgi:hypothetical protein
MSRLCHLSAAEPALQPDPVPQDLEGAQARLDTLRGISETPDGYDFEGFQPPEAIAEFWDGDFQNDMVGVAVSPSR